MKKALAAIMLVLLVGCTTTAEPVQAQNKTSFLEPAFSPTGFLNSSSQEIRLDFGEPAILTAFTINNESHPITREDNHTFRVEKTLDDGEYLVFFSAEDPAGNSLERSFNFTVDTVPPTLSTDPENNEQLSDSEVAISLSFSEPVTIIESRLGASAVSFETSDNIVFTAEKSLENGAYTLLVRAKDAAGNAVSSEIKFTVAHGVKDTVAPPQITGLKAQDTGEGGQIKLSWDATTVPDFKEYRIYRSPEEISNAMGLAIFQAIAARNTDSWVVSGLTNGAKYCFAVTAMDKSNNENTAVVGACATPTESDKTPPVIEEYLPYGIVDDTNTPLIKIVTDEPSTCKYAISSESDRVWTYSNLTHTLNRDGDRLVHTRTHGALANGTWHAYALCRDYPANNEMGSVYTWDFDVSYSAQPDTTPPVLSNISVSVTETTATITWETDEESDSRAYGGTSPGTYIYSANDSAMKTSHSIFVDGLSHSTTYYYLASSCDASGNCANSTEGSFTTLTPDTTPPVISIISPANTTYFGNPLLRFTSNEPVPSCKYSLDGGATNSSIANETAVPSNNGSNALDLFCDDAAGNEGTDSVSYTVNTAAKVAGLSEEGNTTTSITFIWNELTGADEYRVYQNNTQIASVDVTTHTATGLENGTAYTFKIVAVDSSGNPSSASDEKTWETLA